jgi:hypothetical protein
LRIDPSASRKARSSSPPPSSSGRIPSRPIAEKAVSPFESGHVRFVSILRRQCNGLAGRDLFRPLRIEVCKSGFPPFLLDSLVEVR